MEGHYRSLRSSFVSGGPPPTQEWTQMTSVVREGSRETKTMSWDGHEVKELGVSPYFIMDGESKRTPDFVY